MKVKSKFWVESEGDYLIGDGLLQLLEAVDALGSLNRAAASLNCSYRNAWGRVKKVEERLGMKILDTRTGGSDGGGATITPEARVLMDRYRRFREGLNESIDMRFKENFGEK